MSTHIPLPALLGHRVRLRMQATGETWSQAKSALTTGPARHLVPEPTAAQQALEAEAVAALAAAYGAHEPPPGVLAFGIRSVTPVSDGLLVRIERGAAALWAKALLTGALPGLRWRGQGRDVCLYDAVTGARIVLRRVFARPWAAAAARLSPARNAGKGEPAFRTEEHAYEASAYLRRIGLTRRGGPVPDVHVGVAPDGGIAGPRLMDLVSCEPALEMLLDRAPYEVRPGAELRDLGQEEHWRVIERLAGASGRAWTQSVPAPGVTWGQALRAAALLEHRLGDDQRERLGRRAVPVRGAGDTTGEWWEKYDLLRAWLPDHPRGLHRGLEVDGHALGEWVWKQLHPRQVMGSELRSRALAELVGKLYTAMPCRPQAPTPGRGVRAGLEELLEEDERRCRSERAPVVRRAGGPDPRSGLVVQVTLGYQSPDHAATFAVHGGHTFAHLADAIDGLYARDLVHSAFFFYHSTTWKVRPDDWPTDRFERIVIGHPREAVEPAVAFRPGDVPDCDTPLSALLAPGYQLGYQYDPGDKWMHTVRVLRPTHPVEDAQLRDAPTPLVGVRPAQGPPGQYYPEDAPGWGHYLTLPSLRQARPAGPGRGATAGHRE
ncbi:hypothetical protein [Kitasatospora sp. NPDC088783]|uniref:hypothetical protein n=1 Tax=Kitasatospora sp. NPDC088783 TaxID=3364077 RepID=UPI00380FB3BE